MEGGLSDVSPWGNAARIPTQQLKTNPWRWLTEPGQLDQLLKLSEQLSEMPETARTWDERWVDGFSHHDLTDGLIAAVNSWKLPEYLQSGKSATRYVNPNYAHRAQLSQTATRCSCGAIVGKSNRHYDDDEKSEHSDCRIEDRKLADAMMWRKRREAMFESIVYLRSEAYQFDRLGIEKSTMGYTAQRLGIKRQQLRDQSREYAQQVAKELWDDYTRAEIATAFNAGNSTISHWV